MKLAVVISLGLLALPAVAESYADYADVALEKTVRDTDTGARAVVRYFPEIMVGGEEEIVAEDGTVSILNWDGFAGLFEMNFISEPALARDAAEVFLRDAIPAVCPSVDRAAVQAGEIMVDGAYLSLFAQCPEIDAEVYQ